jgi:hypothetical protein
MTTARNRSRRALAATSLAAGIVLAACDSQSTEPPNSMPGVVTLVPGQGTAVIGTTTLKIDGGSTGSENVLVLVDTSTTSISAKVNYSVATTGVGAAGAVSAPATSLAPLTDAVTGTQGTVAAPTLDIGYGMRLNARNRSRLVPGFRAARAAYNARVAAPGQSRSVGIVDPQVGDIFMMNVGSSACGTPVTRAARVVAIGTQSIVLADTLNPSGGFTAADYQRFAARFDTLVYPLDVTNFGQPADIDQNKKIILLFTEAVNELTPRNSSSYVGGFFFSRDLFPIADTPDFQGCAGSNVAEMFYLLAPDPAGLINGNIRRTGFVDSVTTSVLAHEFQHLINASRRLYVTPNVQDFEETWLNEGLSHIAEELLFLHEADLTPRQNLDVTKIRSNSKILNAFNADQSANVARYRTFLIAPAENSPFRDDDSLETRGATWNLLRYLADRKAGGGTSDAATWQALVNTARTGVANLAAVFGSDLATRVRDWSVSHYTDDLAAGVSTEFTQPSWNFRSIFPALSGSGNTYPLQVKTLAAGSASGTLIGASSAYYRFSIPPSTTATITVTAPALVDARVFRVR